MRPPIAFACLVVVVSGVSFGLSQLRPPAESTLDASGLDLSLADTTAVGWATGEVARRLVEPACVSAVAGLQDVTLLVQGQTRPSDLALIARGDVALDDLRGCTPEALWQRALTSASEERDAPGPPLPVRIAPNAFAVGHPDLTEALPPETPDASEELQRLWELLSPGAEALFVVRWPETWRAVLAEQVGGPLATSAGAGVAGRTAGEQIRVAVVVLVETGAEEDAQRALEEQLATMAVDVWDLGTIRRLARALTVDTGPGHVSLGLELGPEERASLIEAVATQLGDW